MNKKDMNKKRQDDDDIQLFSQFKGFLKPNLSLSNLSQSKNNLRISTVSKDQTQSKPFQKKQFSQNKITGTTINHTKTNFRSNNNVQRERAKSARQNVIKNNFEDFQQNSFKLPELKTFYRGNQQSKGLKPHDIYQLPQLELPEPNKPNKQKIYENIHTDRLRQSINKNLQINQKKESSSKQLQFILQLKNGKRQQQMPKNTLDKNKDTFLQYLKEQKYNNNKTNKQTTSTNNQLQQINLINNKRLIKQQQQLLRQINQQNKLKQSRVKQQQFFSKIKQKNPQFLSIIKKYEQKQQETYKDQIMEFKKKINVEKTSTGFSKIKVKITAIQQKQQENLKQQQKEQKEQQTNNKPQEVQISKIKRTWQRLETMQLDCPEISRIICQEQMNTPIDQDQLNQSIIIRQKLTQKVQQQKQKNLDQFAILIIKIAEQMEKTGKPVIMKEKSTIRSQISLRALIGGFMEDTVKVQETIPDNDPNCPFFYDQLQDPQEFQKFCAWYKIKTAKQTGLDPNGIVIHCVTKGSIRVEWSTDQAYVLDAAFVQRPQLRQRLRLHHFFSSYELSPQDFDTDGNIQFFDSKNYIESRGGWPYYQPVKCKRYGINVKGKYDGGDDRWLGMSGKPGEWAVGFHAVYNPGKIYQANNRKTLESIMMGRQRGQMLFPGLNQRYQDTIPVNCPSGEKVGTGIYFSPHIQETFMYTGLQLQQDKSNYVIIFQCRLNPTKIKVTTRETYWVVNHSKDIRPYGVILIKKDMLEKKEMQRQEGMLKDYNYPSIEFQFSKQFKYQNFKQQIQEYQEKFINYQNKKN